MNNKNILIIVVGLLISVWIYSNGVSQRQERELDFQENQRILRENKYTECMNNAFNSYNHAWESSCQRLYEEEDCALPKNLASSYNEGFEKDKKNCVDLYK